MLGKVKKLRPVEMQTMKLVTATTNLARSDTDFMNLSHKNQATIETANKIDKTIFCLN